jgi:hypothetical protein
MELAAGMLLLLLPALLMATRSLIPIPAPTSGKRLSLQMTRRLGVRQIRRMHSADVIGALRVALVLLVVAVRRNDR